MPYKKIIAIFIPHHSKHLEKKKNATIFYALQFAQSYIRYILFPPNAQKTLSAIFYSHQMHRSPFQLCFIPTNMYRGPFQLHFVSTIFYSNQHLHYLFAVVRQCGHKPTPEGHGA